MTGAVAPRRFAIVDTTLREGEQSALAHFASGDKMDIALALEEFGVDYIELTTPMASPGARKECQTIANAIKSSKVLAHVRCRKEDALAALDTGVQGINLFIATSHRLRTASGLGSLDDVIRQAEGILDFIHRHAPRAEVRLSFEDAFRTNLEDLNTFIQRVHEHQALTRIGIADTLGAATPLEAFRLVSSVRAQTSLDIEFHGHDDTGCAVANSFMAIEAGATHIDTSVMGLGERNGITSLAGLIARIYYSHPKLLKKYRLDQLPTLHGLVAECLGLHIPANHYIVGSAAFHHKAGVHTGAVGKDPGAYEALPPEAFGQTRHIDLASRLTGWRAILRRSAELGCTLSIERLKSITKMIKDQADLHHPKKNDIARLIRNSS